MHLTNAKFLYSGESLALIPTFLWLGNALSRSIRLYSNHNTRFYLVLLCITLSRIGNTLMNFIFNSPLDPTQFKVVFITLCLFEFPCSAGMTSLLVWCLYRVCGKGLGNKINLVFLLLAVSQLWNFAAYGILIVQIAAGWSTALGDHMIISWSAFDAVLDMGLSWLLICGLRKQTTKVGTFVSHNRLQMLLIQVELLLPVRTWICTIADDCLVSAHRSVLVSILRNSSRALVPINTVSRNPERHYAPETQGQTVPHPAFCEQVQVHHHRNHASILKLVGPIECCKIECKKKKKSSILE